MNPPRREEKLTQEGFNKILKKAKPDADACMFPNCAQTPHLTIQKDGKQYGVCAQHWSLISRSDVEL